MVEENKDEYNGWVNRETWAVALWLDNDVGLYERCMEMKKEAKGRVELAQALKSFVEDELREYADEAPKGAEIKLMFEDIGSMWRVDWDEVAAHYMED